MKSSLYIAFLPLIAFATFSFTACGDRLPTSPDGDQIMPLKVGNWWVYREIHRGYITHVKYDTIRIVSEAPPPVDVPGAGNSFHDNKGRTYYYVGNELHVVQENCTAFITRELCGARAIYPAKEGATFGAQAVRENVPNPQTPFTVTITHNVVTIVDSIDAVIDVPAGQFGCYVFSNRGVKRDSIYAFGPFRYHYSPGVGLIQIETTRETLDRITDWGFGMELIDYHVE